MTWLRNRFLAMLWLITCPEIALAHGDMTVMLIPLWQIAILVASTLSLRRWPLWRQRGIVISLVLVPTVAIHFFTADLPYVANKYWILPACLLAPIIGWYIGTIFAKRYARTDHA